MTFFPENNNFCVSWLQTSNPVLTSGAVEGFEMLDGAAAPQSFVGLNADRPDKALLNGHPGSIWYYAVGQIGSSVCENIPGPMESATKMELYVKQV